MYWPMRKGVPTLWSVGTSCLAIATLTTSLPPFVFAPVDMSTTFTTSVVVVIIGHSTDYSIIVQYIPTTGYVQYFIFSMYRLL